MVGSNTVNPFELFKTVVAMTSKVIAKSKYKYFIKLF